MVIKDRQAISTEVYGLAASTEPIGQHVKEALNIIEDALDTYTCVYSLAWTALTMRIVFRPDKVSISFNGGKDCV